MLQTRNTEVTDFLKDRTIHSFTYRGITGEIVPPHGQRDDIPGSGYGWALYLYLQLNHMADKQMRESCWLTMNDDKYGFYDYMGSPLGNIAFHGGITYYQKKYGNRESRAIKVGCDYRHYMDEDNDFDLRSLWYDAQCAVDSVHEMTTYLSWCVGCGRLTLETDGYYEPGGTYWRCLPCIQSKRAKGATYDFFNTDGTKADV